MGPTREIAHESGRRYENHWDDSQAFHGQVVNTGLWTRRVRAWADGMWPTGTAPKVPAASGMEPETTIQRRIVE
jgi:hypothetical protein